MSFFVKFLIGGALGGGLTAYYQDDIRRTTRSLSTDLHRLSDELVRSAPNPAAQTTSPAQGLVIPQRLPFTEELKARWNEQLGTAFHAAQNADWSSLASRTLTQLQSSLSSLSTPASQPAAGVSEPAVPIDFTPVGAVPGVGAAEPRPASVVKADKRLV
ncbi:hypothetical protein Rt10032_c08g3544 [Rhodotorula toruloides]|uniref:MICOS complex subunit MIC12 n=1 Tax=Rhodotorula toruloides TaxID=5286 RepID=A0A511KGM7_RHOTO|nr:hypothetical protein Rt10032_c08g3544 [Rhodotorula toruloides]